MTFPADHARRTIPSAFFGRFACCLFAAFSLMAGASLAQQIPNLSSDQLRQIQQQIQGTTAGTGEVVMPQEVILQPNVPPHAPLPLSRLEQLISGRAGVQLRQFGYDQLGVGIPVSVPQMGAVQDDYVLGPGDQIIVTLRGQENSEYTTQVDRDGMVTLPRLSPIAASGRTLASFRADLISAIHRAYVATEGYVTVGRVRQVSVLVSGEVNSPGTRILTGLSTPVEAILVSGGVKKTGSLRNVYVLRGDRHIPIDLYSVLTAHGEEHRVALADGDRIVVPPLGPTAGVVGWVRRPGVYELAGGRSTITVRDLLSLAGGLEVRGKYRLAVLRVTPDGRNQMVMLDGESGTIQDSDILFVQPAASQTSSMATLSGGTPLAGQYPVTGTKLSEILKSPGALGTDPYTLFGIISRRDPTTLLRTLVPFTPVAVLNGSEDMSVQSDDIVRVLSTNEARILFSAVQDYRARSEASQEALRNPQAMMPTQAPGAGATGGAAQVESAAQGIGTAGTTQRQALISATNQATEQAGAMQGQPAAAQPPATGAPQAYPALPSAQYPQQYPTQYPPQYPAQYPQQYPAQYPPSYPSPYASQYPQQYPSQYGPQYPQQYPTPYQPSQQEASVPPYTQNLQESPYVPGQTPSNVEVTRVTDLASQLRVDPLVLINFLEDRSVNVDGAVQGPGLYLVGPDADLQSVVMAAGGVSRWADKSGVEVISTSVDANTGRSLTERRTLSLAGGADASYIVSPRDEVRVNEVFTAVGIGSVTVQGQIRHVGTYQIVRGEHLSDLLMRAGGLTESAYPYGTVYLRRSAAEHEQDAFRREAQEIEDQLLLAMSRRDPNAKLSPDAFTALQNYVQSLRNQVALGRVTVAADPAVLAANPALDPLLEPGDVIFVPQRPYSVAVLGQVLQPGSVPFNADMSASDYIAHAGGYSQFADKSETILVLPDGSARRLEQSWFHFGSDDIPPGSTIYVARDISGVDLHQIIVDTTQIVSQLAVTAASLAVLSTQVNK